MRRNENIPDEYDHRGTAKPALVFNAATITRTCRRCQVATFTVTGAQRRKVRCDACQADADAENIKRGTAALIARRKAARR